VAEVIAPALAEGRTVVCDRFDGSTLAYQGWGRRLAVADLATMSAWATGGLRPDLVVYLRVSPAVAAARRAARGGGADRVEGEGAAFFSRVADGFETLAAGDPGRWVVVDGDRDVEEVAADVAAAVAAAVGRRGP
jgi:dTMP kinase